jgi:hypothetical protein
MALALLVIAAIADLGVAALLIGVSGFIFGAGPESAHGGALLAVAYTGMVIACVAAPAAGFILNRRGKAGPGLAVAWLPPAFALAALAIPAPY